jgi:hypothetical protein
LTCFQPVDHFLVVHHDLSRLKMNDSEWIILKDYETILDVSFR